MKKITPLFTLAAVALLCACAPAASSSEKPSSNPPATSDPATSTPTSTSQPVTSEPVSIPTTSELPEIDYVKVFCETSWTNIWAWDKNGNFFDKWPGEALHDYDNDWKTYDFQGKATPFNVIFNNSSVQTDDLSINSVGYWWFFQNQWYRENPLAGGTSSAAQQTSDGPATSIPSSTDELDNRHRTWYQLLVYSFADSNNDGVGDFKGIVDHLDYLQNLGIGGIWLSPIHPASHYHGYDVLDYYSVNSTYEVGGVTFDKLLQECHKRDIRVLVDLVVNHTSRDHKWRSEHPDWYSGEQIFSDWMPDLNYDNQEVRTEIKNVGKYWLEKGVDGFRCDGAAWIYGGGGGWNIDPNTYAKSVAWWTEFFSAMKAVKSDVYVVGEVWTDLVYVEQFFSSGCSAFNFSAVYWATESIKQENGKNSSNWVQEYANHQKNVRNKDSNAVEASFLSNHDTGRIAMSSGLSTEQLKLANAVNAIAPGGGFVYYGDELGLRGTNTGGDQALRTPMPFANGKTRPNNYMEGSGAGSETASGKTADADASDANSMYNSLANVIKYKNNNPALYNGAVSVVATGSTSLGALKYAGASNDYVVLVNGSNNPVNAQISGDYVLDFAMKSGASLESSQLTVPSYSIVVVKGNGSITISV